MASVTGGDLLSVNEACKYLSVSRATLYREMDGGRLAYGRVGRRGRRLKRSDLDRYLSARYVPAEGVA